MSYKISQVKYAIQKVSTTSGDTKTTLESIYGINDGQSSHMKENLEDVVLPMKAETEHVNNKEEIETTRKYLKS